MKKAFIYLFLFAPLSIWAQDLLTLDQAISNTLQNNLNVKIAQSQVALADNAATIGNAGGLPSVTAGAGASGSLTNTNLVFAGNSQPPLERTGAQTLILSGNITANYSLFNGFVATNTLSKLESQSDLARAQSQLQVEGIVLQTINSYYLALQLQSNLSAAQKSLEISMQRYERAKLRAEYGSANNIALLNAEVDQKNDSIILINLEQQLSNAKNNLLYLMGLEETSFVLENDFELAVIDGKEGIAEQAFEQNLSVLAARHNLEISENDMDIAKGSLYPSLNISTGYSYSNNQSDASFITENRSSGLNGALNLSYNLFAGGRNAIARENSQIIWETNSLRIEDTKKSLTTQIDNAYASYENNVSILGLRESALKVNKLNFSRSEELFKNGQVTGTEFREAQLNLLNAEIQLYLAKISAKLSEYELLRLSGALVK